MKIVTHPCAAEKYTLGHVIGVCDVHVVVIVKVTMLKESRVCTRRKLRGTKVKNCAHTTQIADQVAVRQIDIEECFSNEKRFIALQVRFRNRC